MAIDTVVEEVADNLEEIAEATRRISGRGVGIFLGGVAIGVAAGFYFGYRYNKEQIKAQAFKESQEEIDKIRESYNAKLLVAVPKAAVASIVEEKGYERPGNIDYSRPLPAPVPVRDNRGEGTPPTPPTVIYDGGKDKNHGWNYAKELNARDPSVPYIIHQDEYTQNETEYTQQEYRYFAEDEILVDEDNTVIFFENVLGSEEILDWGHGADDIDVIHIRNDRLQVDAQVTRVAGSYEEEVAGLQNDEG